jgi:hypothetical protein
MHGWMPPKVYLLVSVCSLLYQLPVPACFSQINYCKDRVSGTRRTEMRCGSFSNNVRCNTAEAIWFCRALRYPRDAWGKSITGKTAVHRCHLVNRSHSSQKQRPGQSLRDLRKYDCSRRTCWTVSFHPTPFSGRKVSGVCTTEINNITRPLTTFSQNHNAKIPQNRRTRS